MLKIDLQNKTRPKNGTIESYWFENESAGVSNTLFHRITIPLMPFDSGLDYVEQPEETELVIDWLELDLDDPSNLDGIVITSDKYEDSEASIYIGSAHNWIDITQLKLKKVGRDNYEIEASLTIDFEFEGVAEKEGFHFKTMAAYLGST